MRRSLEEIGRLYEYNRWANQRAREACAPLSAEEFVRPLGSSFSSVRDTLVHLFGAEWIWLERWHGRSPRALPSPAEFASLESIRQKWAEVEKGQRDFIAGLSDARLGAVVSYVNMKGETWSYPLGDMLVHVVNHGSYHRGQVATMLRQLGRTPPGTDYLLYFDLVS
jgi:uncharacterized damage-inducible protein DinB